MRRLSGESENRFFAGCNDIEQVVAAKPRPCGIAFCDQIVDAGPALRIQHQADRIGLVAEHETQELAELNWIGRHRIFSAAIITYPALSERREPDIG